MTIFPWGNNHLMTTFFIREYARLEYLLGDTGIEKETEHLLKKRLGCRLGKGWEYEKYPRPETWGRVWIIFSAD